MPKYRNNGIKTIKLILKWIWNETEIESTQVYSVRSEMSVFSPFWNVKPFSVSWTFERKFRWMNCFGFQWVRCCEALSVRLHDCVCVWLCGYVCMGARRLCSHSLNEKQQIDWNENNGPTTRNSVLLKWKQTFSFSLAYCDKQCEWHRWWRVIYAMIIVNENEWNERGS